MEDRDGWGYCMWVVGYGDGGCCSGFSSFSSLFLLSPCLSLLPARALTISCPSWKSVYNIAHENVVSGTEKVISTKGGKPLLQGICFVLVGWGGTLVRSCNDVVMEDVLVRLFGGDIRTLVWIGIEWECCEWLAGEGVEGGGGFRYGWRWG